MKFSFLKRTDERGFSFMELMVVLAITGLLAALAIPSYISKMPRKRLQEASRGLYGAMQQARMLAVKENRNRSLGFANDSGGDYFYLDENNNDAYDAGEKRVNLADQYSDVKFGNGTAPDLNNLGATNKTPAALPFLITFTPAGTVDVSTANAVYLENITNPSESFAVIAQQSGSIKIVWFDTTTWK